MIVRMEEHPNARAYRRTADAFRAQDMEGLGGLVDDDVVWHVPGKSPLAGEVRGRDALFGWFRRLRDVTDQTFTLLDAVLTAALSPELGGTVRCTVTERRRRP
jgi:ketosteroid isomerase-like protein